MCMGLPPCGNGLIKQIYVRRYKYTYVCVCVFDACDTLPTLVCRSLLSTAMSSWLRPLRMILAVTSWTPTRSHSPHSSTGPPLSSWRHWPMRIRWTHSEVCACAHMCTCNSYVHTVLHMSALSQLPMGGKEGHGGACRMYVHRCICTYVHMYMGHPQCVHSLFQVFTYVRMYVSPEP